MHIENLQIPKYLTKSFSPNNRELSFEGVTKIYALTDTHQDTRKTCALLSDVLKRSFTDKNVLLLNCGDIFKGIYPKTVDHFKTRIVYSVKYS